MNSIENQNTSKRFFLQAKYFFLVRLLQVLITFIILFLFSRVLSRETYGAYQAGFVLINLFGGILFLGLPQQVLSLSVTELKPQFIRLFSSFSWYFIITTATSAIFLLLMPVPFSFLTAIFVFGIICVQALAQLYENLILKLNLDKHFIGWNIFFSGVFIVLHISWLKNAGSLPWLFACVALLNLLKFLGYYAAFNRRTGPGKAVETLSTHLKKQWFFLSFNEILNRVAGSLDKLVIIFLLSAAGFSVYYNGTYEIPFFALLVSAIGNSLTVQLSNRGAGLSEAALIFKNSMIIGSCISFPVFFCFYFFASDFFDVFFNGKYQDAVPLFKISIFIAFLRISNFTAILQWKQQNQAIVTGSIIDIVVNLLLVLLLYPVMGVSAFPVGFISGTAIQIAYYFMKTSSVLKTGIFSFFPWKWLLCFGGSMLMVYAILKNFIQFQNSLVTVALISLVTASFIAVLIMYFRRRFFSGGKITFSAH